MAIHQVNRSILVCDGCATEHGAPAGHHSATEARAAAYADGWRYPATIRGDGSPGTNANDVCPACFPDWVPRRRERLAGYRLQDGTVQR